ncbi:DegT/DnrJ/EryC1/StrS family aminotransferase [Variovorax guangxiensis]|uniref:DegT/DnrJ/EryC1/StrS family aminotransferase n=1 Tax=Variovorax guangxiensis TaxID=1775474 RepID=UPI00285A7263|nr:DegT/DnrJ/EryC1/StrS family aminotransferase [Variovorax guangxiensis]MDR6858974.1 dTDP-4-amino-4,6-dideoxygalactose transaminase [Variovorax guangxiensis]
MPVRSKENFLVFGSPKIEESEILEVEAVMRSGWLGTGPRVARFEHEFGRYRGAPHAVALNSCSAALHLSLLASGVGPGDEVITTPLTFCATVNAIIHAGATPVLADIDPDTLNIDPAQVRARLSPRTRAIVPVHFAGRPCEMDELMALARQHGLKVIEDCAHAIETQYHGRNVGTIGDFGCFSFYVTKNIVTGEGGMVLARKEEDAARIKVLGLHGMSKDAWKRFGDEGYKHYYVVEAGFKYNMMDLQAAIGLEQLAHVEAYWQRRKAIWARYVDELSELPLALPPVPAPETRHAHHLFSVQLDPARCGISRDDFLDAMTAQGIGVGVHYLALPEHPYYQQSLGWRPEHTPHATRVGRGIVSLPISAKLSDQDVGDVISAVRLILQRHAAPASAVPC